MGQNQHARITILHIIEKGTLTAVRYVNEVLDVYVRPYAGAIGADYILLDDNARPHRAETTLTNIWKMLPSLEWAGQLAPRHEPNRACLGHTSESDFSSPSPGNNGSPAHNSATKGMG